MICDDFIERVQLLLHGDMAESERTAAFRHLVECHECRELFAALASADPSAGDLDLSESVLARTSGPSCESARSRLCARLDGELDAVEAELVDGHLGCCAECAALARVLALAQEALPGLAEIDPGPHFVEEILARTSRRQRREPMAEPLAAFISRLIFRRRIAWEGAFVATAFLVAPVAVPGSPFAGLPGRALEMMRQSPRQPAAALEGLGNAFGDVGSPVVRGAGRAWDATGAAAVRTSLSAWSQFGEHSIDTWEAISRSFGTFRDSVASGQTSGANELEHDAAAQDQENKR